MVQNTDFIFSAYFALIYLMLALLKIFFSYAQLHVLFLWHLSLRFFTLKTNIFRNFYFLLIVRLCNLIDIYLLQYNESRNFFVLRAIYTFVKFKLCILIHFTITLLVVNNKNVNLLKLVWNWNIAKGTTFIIQYF